VVFNILFELLTNHASSGGDDYAHDDTLLGENGGDIQQLLVVYNNKQRVLVAHIQLVG